MRILEPMELIEQQEEKLRNSVNEMEQDQRKEFFLRQKKELKDPDTYAALNWLFLGGIHHCYLKKYLPFFIEITILICSIIAYFQGTEEAVLMIVAVAIYELPQLFFSQKIARQYNLDLSVDIYNEIIRKHGGEEYVL